MSTRIQKLIRIGLSGLGVIVLAGVALRYTFGYDAWAYWEADPQAPYDFTGAADQLGAFRYSPVAAQLLSLVNWLPWPAFAALWYAALIGAYVWLARSWSLALLVVPPVSFSLWYGNCDMLIAAGVVAGFRWPAAWAVAFLTKVTPGVAVLWFAVRREWRSLALALGSTALLVAVSMALAPALWLDWPLAILSVPAYTQQGTLIPRIVIAALLVSWGATTGRRWTVPAAAAIASPILEGRALAMLVGVLAIARRPGVARAPGQRSGIDEGDRRRTTDPAEGYARSWI